MSIIQDLLANPAKYSIQEIQKGVQDGMIPAYVGIPLLQDKMKKQQQAQAMAAGQHQQPPIAQQIMQQAAAQPGIAAVPSGMEDMGMAHGGIVAFADGGEAEDEDDESDLIDQYYPIGLGAANRANTAYLLEQLGNLSPDYSGAEGAGTDATLAAPMVGESAPAREAAKEAKKEAGLTAFTEEKRSKRKHPYEELARRIAQEEGVPERLALHAMYKETGGSRDPNAATSKKGAMGIMQLMPGTARDLGVENARDPEQNLRGGMRYLRQQLERFGDERLAAAAYNAGPEHVARYKGVPPFAATQDYVASLARGGVARFDGTNGSLVQSGPMRGAGVDVLRRGFYPDEATQAAQEDNPSLLDAIKKFFAARQAASEQPVKRIPSYANNVPVNQAGIKTLPDRYADVQAGRPAFPEVSIPDFKIGPWGTSAPAAPAKPASVPAAPAMTQGAAPAVDAPSNVDLDAIAGFKGTGTTEAAPKRFGLAEAIQQFRDEKSENKASATRDAWLTAAAATLAGTSQHAMQNIGGGVLAGMKSLKEAAKQSGLDQRTLAQMLIHQESIEENERLGQARIAEQRAMATGRMSTTEQTKYLHELSNGILQQMAMVEKELSSPQEKAAKLATLGNQYNTLKAKLSSLLGMPLEGTQSAARNPNLPPLSADVVSGIMKQAGK